MEGLRIHSRRHVSVGACLSRRKVHENAAIFCNRPIYVCELLICDQEYFMRTNPHGEIHHDQIYVNFVFLVLKKKQVLVPNTCISFKMTAYFIPHKKRYIFFLTNKQKYEQKVLGNNQQQIKSASWILFCRHC